LRTEKQAHSGTGTSASHKKTRKALVLFTASQKLVSVALDESVHHPSTYGPAAINRNRALLACSPALLQVAVNLVAADFAQRRKSSFTCMHLAGVFALLLVWFVFAGAFVHHEHQPQSRQ
jgi:hypothetical protein